MHPAPRTVTGERLEGWENRSPKATRMLVTTMSQDYTHLTETAYVLPVTATQESRPHLTKAWDSSREAGNLAVNIRNVPRLMHCADQTEPTCRRGMSRGPLVCDLFLRIEKSPGQTVTEKAGWLLRAKSELHSR